MSYDILKTLDELVPSVRKAFLVAINDIKSEAQMAVLIAAIKRKDVAGALAAINLDASFFQPLDDALRAAYIEGGIRSLAGLPTIPDPFPVGAWLRGLTSATYAPNSSSEIKAQG
jgi:hypothetical protein